MSSLILGSFVFVLIVTAHLIGWRLLRFERAAKSLIIILIFVTGLSWLLLQDRPAIEIAYIDLIFISLTFAYLLTMPAIESDSPSSVILLQIERAGSEGCSMADLKREITDERFVGERIRGMMKQGFIVQNGNNYSITESGRHFLRVFVFYHIAAGRAHVGG